MPAISRMIVPAGPKCHRKLCSTGVSQDHMPCLQSHQALQATCAFGQPASLIIPGSYTFEVLISKQKGGLLHYVLLCMQQLACTAYFQERKGNTDMAETAKQHTTMINMHRSVYHVGRTMDVYAELQNCQGRKALARFAEKPGRFWQNRSPCRTLAEPLQKARS